MKFQSKFGFFKSYKNYSKFSTKINPFSQIINMNNYIHMLRISILKDNNYVVNLLNNTGLKNNSTQLAMRTVETLSLEKIMNIILRLGSVGGIINLSQLLTLSTQWKGLAVSLRIEKMIVRLTKQNLNNM
jgi:hypothetical protein